MFLQFNAAFPFDDSPGQKEPGTEKTRKEWPWLQTPGGHQNHRDFVGVWCVFKTMGCLLGEFWGSTSGDRS